MAPIDRESWSRLEPVVNEALDLGEAERRLFVERLSADDPTLGRQVAVFLARASEAGAFLTSPVSEHAAALCASLAEEGLAEAREEEDETIGPYRVQGELGRGGMGAVFLAERADGQFDQRVALKLVKRGMDSAEILERFRSERQILARLQHAHIARLLDGGVTRDGQPYFAMEHVEGEPLAVYCEQRSLATTDRLRLFLQVCEAVDYAHRNLVVHRDLKPSNVLVTADGQVKLLDFGIAKVLDPASTDPSVTRREARVLTPRYAAPEQRLGQPVTTATDVYSLGVMLYEVLAGRHPYDAGGGAPEAAEPGLDAALPGPATREPEPLQDPELDSVARMAMRPEPDRRYPSVRALADDVQRRLEGRPVSARPDRFGYRASKFIRRHRLAVTSALVVALSLLAGLFGTLWQARKAVLQAQKAEEVKRFTTGLFELSDPDVARGRDVTARELLARGIQRIDAELGSQPEVQAEMLLVMGNIHHRLGLDREGRPLLERALALRRQRLADDDLGVAEAELALGNAHELLGELEPAEKLFVHALATRQKRLGRDHPDTAYALGQLGAVRKDKGDLTSAQSLLEEAVAIERRREPPSPADLATQLTALGVVLHKKGDLAGAERCYREGLEIRRALFGDDHSRVAESLLSLGGVKRDRGDFRGAESNYRQSLGIHRRLSGPRHDYVANDLNNLGMVLIDAGEYPDAESALRESVDIHREHGTDTPGVAMALHNLARALRLEARLAEAESASRESLRIAIVRFGQENPNVATVRQELARILTDARQRPEAEALARRALATFRARLPPDHPRIAEALVALGHLLVADGRAGEAEALLRDALERRTKGLTAEDWRLAEAHLELGECLLALGRRSEAEPHLASGHQAFAAALGPRHPLTMKADAALARAARGPGQRSPGLSGDR
jgi:eukaryotic-like serine/threonine-protein kinase